MLLSVEFKKEYMKLTNGAKPPPKHTHKHTHQGNTLLLNHIQNPPISKGLTECDFAQLTLLSQLKS